MEIEVRKIESDIIRIFPVNHRGKKHIESGLKQAYIAVCTQPDHPEAGR